MNTDSAGIYSNIFEIGGNRPLILNRRDCLWLVEKGCAELFTVRMLDDEPVGNRRHIMSIDEGGIFFGADHNEQGLNQGYLVVGIPGTRLRCLPISVLQSNDSENFLSSGISGSESGDNDFDLQPFLQKIPELIDAFVEELLNYVSENLKPREVVSFVAGQEFEVPGNTCVGGAEGLCWLNAEKGDPYIYHYDFAPFSDGRILPLSRKIWAGSSETMKGRVLSTGDLLKSGQAARAIHEIMLKVLIIDRHLMISQVRAEFNRLRQKRENDARFVANALNRMKSIMRCLISGERGEIAPDPLFAALQKIGHFMRMDIGEPPKTPANQPLTLRMISNSSHIRTRKVILKSRWWLQDNGPMLGYLEGSDEPVALIPRTPTSYWMENPASGEKFRVTEAVAEAINPIAYSIYKPLPDKKLNLMDLMTYAGRSVWKRDIAVIILMGVLGGIIGLVIPRATGTLFDTIIPEADLILLMQLVLGLVAIEFASFLFNVTQSYAQLRIEGRIDASLQAAVWDKLLRLPVPFFREYTAGDLGSRALAISEIRGVLSGSAMSTLLSGIFTSFNLALMFWYHWRLSLVGLALVGIAFFITFVCSIFRIRYTAREHDVEGRISGLMLQLLAGIPKFRISGAENRAFHVWSKDYTLLQQISFKSSAVSSVMSVINSVYPVICSMVIFFMLLWLNKRDPNPDALLMSTGSFLAFNSAFSALLNASLSIAETMVSVMVVVPLYNRAKPILEALPEVDEARAAPRELSGGIEVNNLTFRYAPDAPEVLKGISFRIKPGEFVALVGPSGCGKSTLLRLLLGFEKPDSGGIYYDGQDLSSIDVTLLRQQLGVVLQNGRLMSGDIFENIVGSRNLNHKDAMEAAKMAGFDRDIEDMPMGLHTIVSEGGANLSGGQRQRLLIARSLVCKPRIIYFDEATSALDNITQKIVSESLEQLNATRIVIAHRLSTVINADRILVFRDGHIIEEGNYAELMKQDGVFAELARRQIA